MAEVTTGDTVEKHIIVLLRRARFIAPLFTARCERSRTLFPKLLYFLTAFTPDGNMRAEEKYVSRRHCAVNQGTIDFTAARHSTVHICFVGCIS